MGHGRTLSRVTWTASSSPMRAMDPRERVKSVVVWIHVSARLGAWADAGMTRPRSRLMRSFGMAMSIVTVCAACLCPCLFPDMALSSSTSTSLSALLLSRREQRGASWVSLTPSSAQQQWP